jgi:hypothetical protein
MKRSNSACRLFFFLFSLLFCFFQPSNEKLLIKFSADVEKRRGKEERQRIDLHFNSIPLVVVVVSILQA